jgi:formiminoglutamase
MKNRYAPPKKEHWSGRSSANKLYLHEKVVPANLMEAKSLARGQKGIGILGYACDEGVKRNQGRAGAALGPDAIRRRFGKMPNHLPENCALFDFGNFNCEDGDMEATQAALAQGVENLRDEDLFCVVLGGGHDMAYGHFQGLKRSLGGDQVLGIINFDAHFDLRSNRNGNNSGTPFFQIGSECKETETDFRYLCLGIREDANDRALYDTTSVFGVNYLEIERFQMPHLELVLQEIEYFIKGVDAVYVTIDLDGFSSAYAMGVSAPSPMGFNPQLVTECLKAIIHSKKMAGLDIAEMNPEYDIDNQTANLAASLLHFAIHRISLL